MDEKLGKSALADFSYFIAVDTDYEAMEEHGTAPLIPYIVTRLTFKYRSVRERLKKFFRLP